MTNEATEAPGRPRRHRWGRAAALGIVGTLAAGAIVVGVEENRRPWYFYDMVGSRLPALNDTYGGHDWRVEVRQQLAPVARDIASWDGVARVEWPKVQVNDDNGGPLDDAEAILDIHLFPDTNPDTIAGVLRPVLERAEREGISLWAVVWTHGKSMTCSVEPDQYLCDWPLGRP